jgi:DUF4097 and DUF4098 domain-containing protein YvlB
MHVKSRVFILAGIIIALVVVCACIGVIFFNFRAQGTSLDIKDITQGIGNLSAFSAEGTDQQTFPVKGPAMVDADTPFGNVTITGGAGKQISVTANKTAYGSTQAGADEALKNLKVTMTQSGDQVTLRVEDPQADSRLHLGQTGKVDFTIRVPTATTAVVHTNSGEVSLTGTQGKADLNSQFGAVDVNDVSGGVAVHTNSGRVSANHIRLLPSGFGDLSLTSEFGDVTLGQVSLEHVMAHSGSGTVVATNVASSNEIDLSSNYGGITLEGGEAASLRASTNSGEISFNQVKVSGTLVAHSDFGALRLTQASAASYDLSCKSGGISLDSASGAVKASTGFGDIQISNGEQATLNLDTNSGQIRYSGSLGAGPHSLQSAFGEIHVTLPAKTALQLDLKTDFGKINTGFAVTSSGTQDSQRLVGSINGGGPLLTATTKSGDIILDAAQP